MGYTRNFSSFPHMRGPNSGVQSHHNFIVIEGFPCERSLDCLTTFNPREAGKMRCFRLITISLTLMLWVFGFYATSLAQTDNTRIDNSKVGQDLRNVQGNPPGAAMDGNGKNIAQPVQGSSGTKPSMVGHKASEFQEPVPRKYTKPHSVPAPQTTPAPRSKLNPTGDANIQKSLDHPYHAPANTPKTVPKTVQKSTPPPTVNRTTTTSTPVRSTAAPARSTSTPTTKK